MIQRKNEVSCWPYITQRVAGFTNQMGHLEGIERISPARNLQLIPYGQFSGSSFLDRRGGGPPRFRSDREVRAGVDAKMVLRDSLALDVTVNPDFSQVEADEPQVTVNQRYEVLFPEKRPFFLENANAFVSPESLFFFPGALWIRSSAPGLRENSGDGTSVRCSRMIARRAR